MNQKAMTWLVGGLMVGAVAAVVVQWGVSEYKLNQMEKRLTAFTEGYNSAKDKKAFASNFDFAGNGFSIGVSISEADYEVMEDGAESSGNKETICAQTKSAQVALNEMFMANTLSQSSEEEKDRMRDILEAEMEKITDVRISLRCSSSR